MKKEHVLSKKLCFIGMVFLLIVSYTSSISAAGVADWTNLSGYKVGEEIVPHVVTQAPTGIQIYSAKGQFDMSANVSGVIYNIPITLDGFSVEFTINRDAEAVVEGDTGADDAWISVNIMNKASYIAFNPATDIGLYSIIKLSANNASATILTTNATGNWACVANGAVAGANIGKKIKIELKKNGAVYDYFINGVAAGIVAGSLDLDTLYGTSSKYLSLGLSCKNGKPMQITVTKINGTSLAPAVSSASSSIANPTTGDQESFPLPFYVILSAIAIAITIVLIKRKTGKE